MSSTQGILPDSFLSHARYGKDKVRVFRVVRDGKWHRVVEYNVTVLLEGDIATSYTVADNSVVVATDSMKNITYYLAKFSPHILIPEHFALHLGTHIVSKYAHIHKAFVTIEKLRWSRIQLDAPADDSTADPVPHPHSFIRDGEDKRVVRVEVDATRGKDKIFANISSGIVDLLVLKSTGSGFSDFIRDEYTTLVETPDRILSTAVEVSYTFPRLALIPPSDERKLEFVLPWADKSASEGSVGDADGVEARVRRATLEIFAVDDSDSVQATLFRMGQRVIAENADVLTVTYALPNKHYIPVDMKYIGVDNMSPANAEVFVPVAAPSGLITATVTRK